MIEIKNLNKTFSKNGRSVKALSDINLFVPKGQIFGIMGASGAGKSTLIRSVNLLERPDSGEIWIAGKNLMSLSSRELAAERRDIGMIFQHFNLLSSKTIWRNVALPLELAGVPAKQIQERVAELLSLVGLLDKAHDYPASLSGGQKQRVAIARALATNPTVLLSDEATSALDPETTDSILSLLKEINRTFQITIVLITHQMNVIKTVCDTVAVIADGKITEQGHARELSFFAKEGDREALGNFPAKTKKDFKHIFEKRLSKIPVENSSTLIQLDFNKTSASTGILSEASRMFNINNTILSATADTDYSGEFEEGTFYIKLEGDKDDTDKAIVFYKEKNITVEVLGYV